MYINRTMLLCHWIELLRVGANERIHIGESGLWYLDTMPSVSRASLHTWRCRLTTPENQHRPYHGKERIQIQSNRRDSCTHAPDYPRTCGDIACLVEFLVASFSIASSPAVPSSLLEETCACLRRGVPFPLTLKPCFCCRRIKRIRHAALLIPRDLDAVAWSTYSEGLVSII